MHAALAAPYPKKQLDMHGFQPRPAALRAQLYEAYKRHDLGTRLEAGEGSGVEVVKRVVGGWERGEMAGTLARPTRQSPHWSPR